MIGQMDESLRQLLKTSGADGAAGELARQGFSSIETLEGFAPAHVPFLGLRIGQSETLALEGLLPKVARLVGGPQTTVVENRKG